MTPLETALATKIEREVQMVLEQFPDSLAQNRFACEGLVISQLPIGQSYRCDFAFIHERSGISPMILIELAPLTTKIFTAKGGFTAKFHHEVQQVLDWLQVYHKHYQSLRDDAILRFGQHFAWHVNIGKSRGELYIGRRSELDTFEKQERWRGFTEQHLPRLNIRTYDSLIEQQGYINVNYPQTRVARMSDRQP